MRVIRTFAYLFVAIIVLTGAVLYLRSDVEPQRWTPAPLPVLSDAYAPAGIRGFDSPTLMPMPAAGPEDVAMDSLGRFYTGLSDGRILRFSDDPEQAPEMVVNTGGRPLGLQFDADDRLIIADADKGLLRLTADGRLKVLVDQIEGKRLRLVDDLDIASDGTIWFSDASQRFGVHAFMKDFLEASFTGRLLSYSPGTGTTTVRMDGLFFANGVALGPDERFVLVSETGTGRIHRLWLKSDKAGQRDVFHDGLPGNPDNLSFNGTDTFWIAMPGVRDPAIERSADSLFIRKLLGGLPDSALALPSSTALVAGLGVDGAVVHVLYADPAPVSGITSINQFGDRLVMGSLTARHVMSVPVPPPANQERFP